MASNSLALPVDIPWERWCISEDMMDKEACDTDRPAKWQSSIAVFKYVPEDDYQVYPGRKITYLKVVCTISGYQPKKDEIQGVLENLSGITTTEIAQEELERKLATYRPCNEAIVQVTVAPPQGSGVPLNDYPYIMDFQPKKRELYEMATDTKEFMSRSAESLNIRKSAGTTQSQEVLDVDQGFNAGVNFEYKGTGGGVQYGTKGEWGTKNIGSSESGLARTTDESHERRETVSHTTQLTQLYHLLDSYHLGTNRIVFFVQPRPHVIASSSGIVSGPRPVEGIQEFFLVVNQPKDQKDFCLDVRLDTGHLYEKPIMAYDYKTDTTEFLFSNPTPVKEDADLMPDGQTWGDNTVHDEGTVDGGKFGQFRIWTYDAKVKYNCVMRTRSNSTVYQSPHDGYDIDVNNENNIGGFHILAENKIGDVTSTINPTPDGKTLTIQAMATSRACFKLGVGDMYEAVWVNPNVDNIVKGLAAAETAAILAWDLIDASLLGTIISLIGTAVSFISTEEAVKTAYAYATAPDAIHQQPSSADIKLEVFLKSHNPIIDTGETERIFFITTRGLCCCDVQGTKQNEGIVYEGSLPIWQTAEGMTIKESNAVTAAMRQEMLQSLVSPRRTEPRPLADTKMVVDLALPTILKNPIARTYLSQSCADVIPNKLAGSLSKTFRKNVKQITRLDLLTMNAPVLAQVTGLDDAAARQLKVAMLTTPVKAPPMPKQPKAVQQPKTKASKPAASKQRGSAKRSNRKSGK